MKIRLAGPRVEDPGKGREDTTGTVPWMNWAVMAFVAVLLFGCFFLAIRSHMA
jgi:hypothetical protein